MATCNVQDLLDANPCFGALAQMDLSVIEVGFLCAIKERINGGGVPSCDIQTLLNETKCFRHLYPVPLDAISAQLALDIAGLVGIPVVNGCLAGLNPWNLSLVITQLYCAILAVLDVETPAENCDIQTLLTESRCFNDVQPIILSRLRASLLCQIAQTITDPPIPPTCALSITAQPNGFSGDAGDNFSLTVSFSGQTGTATVQWQRDDGGSGWIDIVDGEFDGTSATGAQTPTLTIVNAQTFTSGNFRVIITDPAIDACSVTSNVVAVTIAAATGNHLLPNLLAYYRFEEASGNASDSSGNSRTLTENGTVIGTAAGIVQRAREYTAVDHSYFSIGNSAFTNLAALSVTVWCQFVPRELSTNDMTMVAKGSYADSTLAWWILLDHGTPDDSVIFFYTTDGINLQQLVLDLGGSVDPSQFYFISLRWDGSTLRLSATTQDQSTVSAGVTTAFAGPFYNAADPLVVGDMPGTSIYGMGGVIDELGLWSRSLSDCELDHLFTARNGTFTYPVFDLNLCA